jgi:hypothetical protein
MKVGTAVLVGVVSLAAAPIALAQNWTRIGTNLDGYEEVAPAAAASTVATGQFDATINHAETAIDYVLSYSDLEGAVQQAHIHFGRRGTNGGISVFLCTNLGNGPAGTQTCPPSPATVSGTIMAADVVGPTAQGIAPGEFAELIRAIRNGATYVNVHSTKFPGGEVRGQLDAGHSH